MSGIAEPDCSYEVGFRFEPLGLEDEEQMLVLILRAALEHRAHPEAALGRSPQPATGRAGQIAVAPADA